MSTTKKINKEINDVLIVLKPKVVNEFSNILPNLVEWLQRRKKKVLFRKEDDQRINKIFKKLPKTVSFISDEKMHSVPDLIITLGGDGTLIGVARKAKKNSPPIFGVNMGRLGFITEFSKSEYYDELAKTIKGDFEVTKTPLYLVEVIDGDTVSNKGYFLNDIVINKNDISRMFSVTVECNEELVFNVSGDGLIISSPIGSTAYSLAAGGPIIHPQVDAMVVTPICPHSLNHRPLVIPAKDKLSVRFPTNEGEIHLTLDGQEILSLGKNLKVSVSKSHNHYVKMVINEDRTYFHTLKEKLTHGRREA